MLTSMFYYDLWRPYIVRDADSAPRTSPSRASAFGASSFKKARAAATAASGEQSPILLNKSLNKDSIGFAQDVYRSVVSLKEATRSTLFSAERFDRRADIYGEDTAREYLGYGLSDFVKSYNAASGFLPLQEHSRDLVSFFDGAEAAVNDGSKALARLGVRRSGGSLTYSPDAVNNMSLSETRAAIDEARPFIEDIYNGSLDVMKKPLTAHMEFRSFRYYYNYQTGVTKQDTFSAMGTGTMVDIAL